MDCTYFFKIITIIRTFLFLLRHINWTVLYEEVKDGNNQNGEYLQAL